MIVFNKETVRYFSRTKQYIVEMRFWQHCTSKLEISHWLIAHVLATYRDFICYNTEWFFIQQRLVDELLGCIGWARMLCGT